MTREIYIPCADINCLGHIIELPDEIMEECVITKEDKCEFCGDTVRVKLVVEVLS